MMTFKRITGPSTLELDRPQPATRAVPAASPEDWRQGGDGHGNGSAGPPHGPLDAQLGLGSVFEPPGSKLLVAISRHKLLVCVCALLFAAVGVGVGVKHRSTYTSTATLQVGQVNPNSPGFYGYVQSAAALATAFSRAIDAAPVLGSIQHQLHLAPASAIERLSAEPLPSSPAFRVVATGPSEAASAALANAAALAIVSYEGQTNSANPAAASLLHEYREASLARQRADAKLADLHHAHASAGALEQAEVARSTALVRLQAIETAYTGAVTSQAPRTGLVSLLAGATGASSDHRAKIELFGFLGLLAGAIIGCFLAAARERRSARRPVKPASEVSSAAPA
jgi:Chain length determinant protein